MITNTINNSAKVIEIDQVSKACKSKGKKDIIIKNQPSAGHQIIEGTFGVINNFLKGMFGIMQSFLKSGMGWGIIIIILLQCTAARAAPIQGNDSLSPTPITEMNQTTIPEAFSFLGFGSSTIIYAAYTMFSKTYIINLGDAEDRLTKDISASCNAISTQDKMCRENPASCPMAHLNKANYGSSIKKNFQTMSALRHVCDTKKRRSSTEVIELCTQGKEWIIPEKFTPL